MTEMPEFLFSGTLGDAYIALCKLDSSSRQRSCTLRRLCRHPGVDGMVSELVSLFLNIRYIPEFVQFNTIEEMREYAFANSGQYINIFWDGNGRGNEPDDSGELIFTTSPQLAITPRQITDRRAQLAIQLHSGSRPDDRRGLDITWIVELCDRLRESSVGVVILGTGEGYTQAELGVLKSLPSHAMSLVGETQFKEWLRILAGTDYLITPEGLACFFALSQGTPCLILYKDTTALLRMPPEWRKNATCVRPLLIGGDGPVERWFPFSAEQTASIVLAMLDPEAA